MPTAGGSPAISRRARGRRRVHDVAGPWRFVARRRSAADRVPDRRRELVDRGHLSPRDVVGLAAGCRVGVRRPQVRIHRVGDISEVPALRAVAIDDRGLAGQVCPEETRDHRGVGPVRILPRAEDVEVAQPDELHAVAAGEDAGELFVHGLRERVGRERPPFLPFFLGQPRAVAVDAGGGGVDDPPDAGIARRGEDVGGPGHIDGDARRRVLHRPRHRTEGRLVKDDGGSRARPAAGLGVADVRLEKLDPVRAVREIRPLSVGKVVDSPDPGSPWPGARPPDATR